ncbi:MAG: hypothetical protein ACKJSK_02360 [Roseibacillus sp.]
MCTPRAAPSTGSRPTAAILNAKSGQRYAFALMINNYTGEVSPLKAKIVRIWNKMVVL